MSAGHTRRAGSARRLRAARPATRRAAGRCATSTRSPTPRASPPRAPGGAVRPPRWARWRRRRDARRRRRRCTGSCWPPARRTSASGIDDGRVHAARRSHRWLGAVDAADEAVLGARRGAGARRRLRARPARRTRSTAPACPRSASTSRPARSAGSRAAAARRAVHGLGLRRRARAPATGDRPAAGRQHRHRRRPGRAAAPGRASCCRPAASSLAEVERARRRDRSARTCAWRPRPCVGTGSRGRRVGLDGLPRSPRAPGSRCATSGAGGRWFASLARMSRSAAARPVRDRGSGARRCAARG